MTDENVRDDSPDTSASSPPYHGGLGATAPEEGNMT